MGGGEALAYAVGASIQCAWHVVSEVFVSTFPACVVWISRSVGARTLDHPLVDPRDPHDGRRSSGGDGGHQLVHGSVCR